MNENQIEEWTFEEPKNTIHAFSEALSDENIIIIGAQSSATRGQAGDQTGGELSIRQWYQHDAKWAKVYRIRDDMEPGDGKGKIVREKMAQFMEDSIINGYVGYTQNKRSSYHNQLLKNGYDPNRVLEPCATDCSGLVFSALQYALGEDFRIDNRNIIDEQGDIIGIDKPTMTIDGTIYDSCFNKCDKFARTSSNIPTGHNFDYIFERVLPLMGYQVDVFTMPNKGVKWQYSWPAPSTGIRYMEIADYVKTDEQGEIIKDENNNPIPLMTPYAYIGHKVFRVKKELIQTSDGYTESNNFVIDERSASNAGIINYRAFVNASRICQSPYDYIYQDIEDSIKAYNGDYLIDENGLPYKDNNNRPYTDYIKFATEIKCRSPFDANIEPIDESNPDSPSLPNVNQLVAIQGKTITDPNGQTNCQIYQLMYNKGNGNLVPVYDQTLYDTKDFPKEVYEQGPPIYVAFFKENYTNDSETGKPLLGVKLTNKEFTKLKANLHVHIHGQDGFDFYDFIINVDRNTKEANTYPFELRRGDVVRTRGYSALATRIKYDYNAIDEGTTDETTVDASAEPYLTSPGHIAIWV